MASLDGQPKDDEKGQISVGWYEEDGAQFTLYLLVCLLSIFIVPIVALFDPPFGIRLRCKACPAEEAAWAIVTVDGKDYLCKTKKYINTHRDVEETIIACEANCLRYYASSLQKYELHAVPEVPLNYSRFLEPSYSVSREERHVLLSEYGENRMAIPDTSVFEVALKHALNPIILFGWFAFAIWLIEDYIFYSYFLLAVLLLAIYAMTLDTLYNLEKLKSLAGQHDKALLIDPRKSNVKGDPVVVTVDDLTLCVGDRILLKTGFTLPCDVVLLSGRVVVDEAKLTGESIPVAKSPIEREGLSLSPSSPENASLPLLLASETYSNTAPELDIGEKRPGNVLFGGTIVKSTTNECIGVVYKTGFRSAKGVLISTLLTPKDRFLRILEDLILVIVFLFLIASLLFIYEAIYLRSIGTDWGEIVLHYFDALTVAIPVALVICIVAATSIAIWRLRFKGIYVSESSAVNMAGICSVACFDKTGTLTEENLFFQEASVSAYLISGETLPSTGGGNTRPDSIDCGGDVQNLPKICQEIMACCHNLSVLSPFAPPVGDLLEVELMRASCWTLHSPTSSGRMAASPPVQSKGQDNRHDILRHWEFTPEKLRAASLIRRPSGEVVFLLKGSPETIIGLCRPDTVPNSIHNTLRDLAKRGLRVIAMAFRKFTEDAGKLASSPLEQVEGRGDIIFVGLLCLSNRLKLEAVPTIIHLHKADIHVAMITGDHIQTAIAVAIQCGILRQPSLAQNCLLYIVDEADDQLQITNFLTDEIEKLMSLEDLLIKTATANSGCTPIDGRGNATADSRVQIACTGRCLRLVQKTRTPAVTNSLIRAALVFARTKPTDKKLIVEEIMYTPAGVVFDADDGEEDEVIFTGDGANDMAALRACTVGLSLCDIDTSIAAPVTSKHQTPGAVIDLMLEGRCSLITTYVLVHYNIMFGYIVLLMTCLLYGYGLIVSDSMYFIQGLFYSALPGIAIALTPSSANLGVELPPKRYFTPWLLTQMVPQLAAFSGVQVYALYLLSQQSFYVKYTTDDPLSSTYSYEATVLEDIVLAQLMIASVVSTIGEPYREEWYMNFWHMGILALLTGWWLYQCFAGTSSFAEDTLNLMPIPTYFGYYIIAIAAVNVVISFLIWAVADRCCRSPRKRRQLAIVRQETLLLQQQQQQQQQLRDKSKEGVSEDSEKEDEALLKL